MYTDENPLIAPIAAAIATALAQLEIGPQLAAVILGVANIIAAVCLAAVHARMKRLDRDLTRRRTIHQHEVDHRAE